MINNKQNNGNCQQKKRRFLNIDYESLVAIEENKKYKGTMIDLKCFFIYLHSLATTNDYYMIGVYKEVGFSKIKEDFEISQQKSYDNKQIVRMIDRLCELKVLKVYDKTHGYLMTISRHFDDMQNLMKYVNKNEEEFQFHKHINRRNEFYSFYGKYINKQPLPSKQEPKVDDDLLKDTPFEKRFIYDDDPIFNLKRKKI